MNYNQSTLQRIPFSTENSKNQKQFIESDQLYSQ